VPTPPPLTADVVPPAGKCEPTQGMRARQDRRHQSRSNRRENVATQTAASTGRLGPEAVPLVLRVNGQDNPLAIEPRVTLLDALREHLGLMGSKKGCAHGECGACTVLVDGRRVNACMTFAVMRAGQAITTIEGLADGDALHPLQEAFIHHDGFQCGYCTPGQIMSAVSLLAEGHTGTDAEIREWMSGNICRCSAYPNIVAAIAEVARKEARCCSRSPT